MKNLVTLTGIDGTKLLLDTDQFSFGQEVSTSPDHFHSELYLKTKASDGSPMVLKVNDPLDIIKEKIYGNVYGALGGKL